MADTTITLLIHGAIALALIAGGIGCLVAGVRLLKNKNDVEQKNSFLATIGTHKVSFTAGAAGTCVVMTSAVWVIGAVWTVPTYSLKEGETKVSQLIEYAPNQTALTGTQKDVVDRFMAGLGSPRSHGAFKVLSYMGSSNGSDSRMRETAEKRGEAVKQYLDAVYKVPSERAGLVSFASTERPVNTSTSNSEGGVIVVFDGGVR